MKSEYTAYMCTSEAQFSAPETEQIGTYSNEKSARAAILVASRHLRSWPHTRNYKDSGDLIVGSIGNMDYEYYYR